MTSNKKENARERAIRYAFEHRKGQKVVCCEHLEMAINIVVSQFEPKCRDQRAMRFFYRRSLGVKCFAEQVNMAVTWFVNNPNFTRNSLAFGGGSIKLSTVGDSVKRFTNYDGDISIHAIVVAAAFVEARVSTAGREYYLHCTKSAALWPTLGGNLCKI